MSTNSFILIMLMLLQFSISCRTDNNGKNPKPIMVENKISESESILQNIKNFRAKYPFDNSYTIGLDLLGSLNETELKTLFMHPDSDFFVAKFQDIYEENIFSLNLASPAEAEGTSQERPEQKDKSDPEQQNEQNENLLGTGIFMGFAGLATLSAGAAGCLTERKGLSVEKDQGILDEVNRRIELLQKREKDVPQLDDEIFKADSPKLKDQINDMNRYLSAPMLDESANKGIGALDDSVRKLQTQNKKNVSLLVVGALFAAASIPLAVAGKNTTANEKHGLNLVATNFTQDLKSLNKQIFISYFKAREAANEGLGLTTGLSGCIVEHPKTMNIRDIKDRFSSLQSDYKEPFLSEDILRDSEMRAIFVANRLHYGNPEHLLKAHTKLSDLKILQSIVNRDLKSMTEIGHGSFGTVFDPGNGLVVKVINDKNPVVNGKNVVPIEIARSEIFPEHSNIVKYYGAVKKDNVWYLVYEKATGGSLYDYLQKGKKVKEEAIEGLLNGLKTAHDAGIVHRDLHEGNILVNQKNGKTILQIADPGLAFSIDTKNKASLELGIGAYANVNLDRLLFNRWKKGDLKNFDPKKIDIKVMGILLSNLANSNSLEIFEIANGAKFSSSSVQKSAVEASRKLRELFSDMEAYEPSKRPDIDKVIKRYQEAIQSFRYATQGA